MNNSDCKLHKLTRHGFAIRPLVHSNQMSEFEATPVSTPSPGAPCSHSWWFSVVSCGFLLHATKCIHCIYTSLYGDCIRCFETDKNVSKISMSNDKITVLIFLYVRLNSGMVWKDTRDISVIRCLVVWRHLNINWFCSGMSGSDKGCTIRQKQIQGDRQVKPTAAPLPDL